METPYGQQLRQAREAKGLSLGQVAQATRIRPHFLTALEAGDLKALPSLVQAKGFLRLYASYLKLDPVPLLAALEAKRTPPPDAAPVRVELRPMTPAEDELLAEVSDGQPAAVKTTRPDPDGASSPAAITPAAASPAVASPVQAVSTPPSAQEISPSPPTPTTSPPGYPSHRLPPASPTRTAAIPWAALALDGSAQAILESIGAELCRQRQALGLSLEDAERYTHLRLHNLRALEDGRLDDLPSPVQGRGMLNNYARFLNMDGEALLLRYAEALQLRRVERFGSTAPRTPARQVQHLTFRRLVSVDLLVGVILVAGLLGLLLWGASRVLSFQTQPTPATTLPDISAMLGATDTSGENTQTPGAGQNSTNPGAQPTPGTGTPGTPLPQAAAQTPQPTLIGTFIANSPVTVMVVARQTVWVRINVDGKLTFQGRLVQGSAYTFAGSKQVEMISGDASALQVFFQQQDLGSLGVQAQVVDLIFTPEGLVKPTATITPTPSRTPLVSLTPTAGTITPRVGLTPTPGPSPSPSPTPSAKTPLPLPTATPTR